MGSAATKDFNSAAALIKPPTPTLITKKRLKCIDFFQHTVLTTSSSSSSSPPLLTYLNQSISPTNPLLTRIDLPTWAPHDPIVVDRFHNYAVENRNYHSVILNGPGVAARALLASFPKPGEKCSRSSSGGDPGLAFHPLTHSTVVTPSMIS